MDKKRRMSGFVIYILLLLLMVGIVNLLLNRKGNVRTDYTNATLKQELKEENIITKALTLRIPHHLFIAEGLNKMVKEIYLSREDLVVLISLPEVCSSKR